MPEISGLFHVLINGVLLLRCEGILPPDEESGTDESPTDAPAETLPGQGNVAV